MNETLTVLLVYLNTLTQKLASKTNINLPKYSTNTKQKSRQCVYVDAKMTSMEASGKTINVSGKNVIGVYIINTTALKHFLVYIIIQQYNITLN